MEMGLYSFTESFVSCFLIVCGLSLLVSTRTWLRLIDYFYSMENDNLVFATLGLCFLYMPLGLFIVVTHNDWFLGPSLIVTLVGWITLVKTLFFMMFPTSVTWFKGLYYKMKEMNILNWYIRVMGVLYIVMGALVLLPRMMMDSMDGM